MFEKARGGYYRGLSAYCVQGSSHLWSYSGLTSTMTKHVLDGTVKDSGYQIKAIWPRLVRVSWT